MCAIGYGQRGKQDRLATRRKKEKSSSSAGWDLKTFGEIFFFPSSLRRGKRKRTFRQPLVQISAASPWARLPSDDSNNASPFLQMEHFDGLCSVNLHRAERIWINVGLRCAERWGRHVKVIHNCMQMLCNFKPRHWVGGVGGVGGGEGKKEKEKCALEFYKTPMCQV